MDWTPRNAILLLTFLTEAAIIRRESDAGELLKFFARSIMDRAKEEETTSKADEANNDDSVITIKAKDAKSANPVKSKQAAAKTLTTIVDNCDNVLAFLQAVAVKYPRVIAVPLSLRADKRASVWFQHWTDVNLPTPPKPSPQDHMGLMNALTDVATRLHTARKRSAPLSPPRARQKKRQRGGSTSYQ